MRETVTIRTKKKRKIQSSMQLFYNNDRQRQMQHLLWKCSSLQQPMTRNCVLLQRNVTSVINNVGTVSDLPFCCLDYGYKTKCGSCDVKDGGARRIVANKGVKVKGINRLPGYVSSKKNKRLIIC